MILIPQFVAGWSREWCVCRTEFPVWSRLLRCCGRILEAIDLARNGDTIYVDGQGSDEHPYQCNTHGGKREAINKSLSIVGRRERAFLSCEGGLWFKAELQGLQVTLKNLAFVAHGVNFTGNSNVSISNCMFLNCYHPLNMTGAVLSLFLETSIFENNINCMTISTRSQRNHSQFLEVNISGCAFKNNRVLISGKVPIFREILGMLSMRNVRGRSVIRINSTLFQENHSTGHSFVIGVKSKKAAGYLAVWNSSFLATGRGLLLEGVFNVSLSNLRFKSNTEGLRLIVDATESPSNISLNIILRDSIFFNNTAALFLNFWKPRATLKVHIINCLFEAYQESRQQTAMEFEEKCDCPNAHREISIQNVTFQSIRGGAIRLSKFTTHSNLTLEVSDSRFIENENFDYYNRTGYIMYVGMEGDIRCDSTKVASWVFIRNTTFQGNLAFYGILYARNVEMSIVDCNFSSNFFQSSQSAMIRHENGRGRLNITGGSFVQGRNHKKGMTRWPSFIYSLNTGELVIERSSFLAKDTSPFYALVAAYEEERVRMDNETTIQCPVGTQLNLINWYRQQGTTGDKRHCRRNLTTVKVVCEICPPNTYSLQHGQSVGLSEHNPGCQPCPFGATCLHGAKANPGYWGFTTKLPPKRLTFVPCPMGYCSPPNSTNLSEYNGCYGRRNGTLCGTCVDRYSEALFSTECREQGTCQDYWFWVYTAAYSLAFVFFLTFRKRLFSFLWRQIFWFRKDSESQTAHFDDGYLKIVFYFYQVVELLLINDSEFLLSKLIPPLSAWFDLFNFQLRYFSERIGCPFPGLTPVTKELFLCLRVFTTMTSCAVVFFIHKGITKIGGWRGPSPALYLAVLLEILLLGYERLADTALSLLHCVPIGSEQRLFLDGNVNCWQWWQFALVGYIIVFVAPFIMVLYFGSLSLYKKSLSVKEFLGACALPLPFLVRWAVQHIRGTRSQEDVHNPNGEEIKEVLYDSFRAPKEGDPGAVYWESVLTGRRFVLVCLHSFIASPVYRLMCLECACVLILVHHVMKRPYQSTRANVFEGLSLIALVVIATFNLVEASFLNASSVLEWMEVALLGFVPAAACIFGAFGLLSQLSRLVFLVVVKTSHNLSSSTTNKCEKEFDNSEQKLPLLARY